MATFNASEFTVAVEVPVLVLGVGFNSQVDRFVEIFGTHWKRTPTKDCWTISSKDGKHHFTMVPFGDRYDIAHYEYDTVAEFRSAFSKREHVCHASYFQTEESDLYTGAAVYRYLKKNGYWKQLEESCTC